MNVKEGFKLNMKNFLDFLDEFFLLLLAEYVFFNENMELKVRKQSGKEHKLHQRDLCKKRKLIRTDRVKGERDQSKKTNTERLSKIRECV